MTMLSIVLPTRDDAATLGRALAALSGSGLAQEILVVDGGSRDFTGAVARRHGARVVDSPPRRGEQLGRGASEAAGDWLLFLCADTVLAPGWAAALGDFMADPANARRAAHFRLVLDDPSPAARRLERWVGWRCRRLGLPDGGQGLALSRAFYDELGGYPPLPLMEDVALARRIRRDRLVELPVGALTSARRYREGGWLLRPLRGLACLALHRAGLPPALIARLYD